MTHDPEFVPVLRDDLQRRDVDLGTVVWSPERTAPVALDAVASVMLSVIDGTATVGDLTADVRDVVGVPEAAAASQVDRIVRLFDRAGLLATSAAEPTPPARGIFVSPVSSCMETSSCTGKVTPVNLEIAGEPFRVAVGSARVARRLQAAMGDHIVAERAPLAFMLRAPHRRQREHVLVDRGGFTLGTTRHADEALGMLGGHLAGLVPPRPGIVRLRVRALVRDDGAVLCPFPVLFAPPIEEELLDRTGYQVLDRLAVDVDPGTGHLVTDPPPWEHLASLRPPPSHRTTLAEPRPATAIIVGRDPGALRAPTKAELIAMLAVEAISGEREEVLDLAVRLAEGCRLEQVDPGVPGSLLSALVAAPGDE